MKWLILFLILLVLVACENTYAPGEYVVIPLNQTVTPEVIHYSDSNGEYTIYYGITPTPVVHPTVTPSPTTIPIPTDEPTPTQDNLCHVRSTVAVNLRSLPIIRSDTFVRTLPAGQEYIADAQYNDGTRLWFRLVLENSVGWSVGSYFDTETSLCANLGVVNPF